MAASYGSETAIVITDINGMADDAVGHSASVDNGTNLFHGADLELTLDTGSGTPTAEAGWHVWLEGSVDGSVFPTDTDAKASSVYMGFYPAPLVANTQRIFYIDTMQFTTMLPEDWLIKVFNAIGGAMGSDTELSFKGKKLA